MPNYDDFDLDTRKVIENVPQDEARSLTGVPCIIVGTIVFCLATVKSCNSCGCPPAQTQNTCAGSIGVCCMNV